MSRLQSPQVPMVPTSCGLGHAALSKWCGNVGGPLGQGLKSQARPQIDYVTLAETPNLFTAPKKKKKVDKMFLEFHQVLRVHDLFNI